MKRTAENSEVEVRLSKKPRLEPEAGISIHPILKKAEVTTLAPVQTKKSHGLKECKIKQAY